ncbi:MAG: hypothetical protein CVV37_05670 [Nitrospira bacterium HGW-Nitrospira-1]|nr:MAG: hypothetical protein CVV37_05670 [Nitrospira bacterium HGW-Nitrospira-1]
MKKDADLKCKDCGGPIKLLFGCCSVSFCCMECSKRFGPGEYVHEIDEATWEKISSRSCDRA